MKNDFPLNSKHRNKTASFTHVSGFVIKGRLCEVALAAALVHEQKTGERITPNLFGNAWYDRVIATPSVKALYKGEWEIK